MSKEITIIKTGKFKISQLDGRASISIIVDGKTTLIDWNICNYNPKYDALIKYKTKKFKGFVVLYGHGLNGMKLKVMKVDTKTTRLVELMSIYKVDRYEPYKDTMDLKYDMKTKEFTIISKESNDIVFKLKDLEKIWKK